MKIEDKNRLLMIETQNRIDVAIDFEDMNTLRRASLVLDRFHLLEANGNLSHDEDSDTYILISEGHCKGKYYEHRSIYRNDYTPAIKRIKAICKKYNLDMYIQGDPRGCPLYIAKSTDGMTDCNYPNFQAIYNK